MIVIFDVEGVLVDGEFLPELAKLVGKHMEVSEITLRGIRGEIEWQEGLRQRMELLKGVDYGQCVAVANRLPLMKGAREMATELKKMGCIMVGVSGGLLPCPSALVVLLAAISLHRVAFGLLLIVAFSAGLALAITGVGLLAVLAKSAFRRASFEGRLMRLLPAASALVILVAGVVMTVRALPKVG